MENPHLKPGTSRAENGSVYRLLRFGPIRACLWWLADRDICRNSIEEAFKRNLLRAGRRRSDAARSLERIERVARPGGEDTAQDRVAKTGL